MLETAIASVEQVTRDVLAFELESLTSPLPSFEPGSHVDVELPDGSRRSYSLIGPRNSPARYRIAVKLLDDGKGGSRLLHQRARVGLRLPMSAPRNNFPLDREAPHTVFIAGGIGITPIWSMIDELERIGRSWELHYGVPALADAAFSGEIGRLSGAMTVCESRAGARRRLDVAKIVEAAPIDSRFYCCGPAGMLLDFRAATAGLPKDVARMEAFAAIEEIAERRGDLVVELAQSGQEIVVPDGKSILFALLEAGIDVPYSCTEGTCGSCEARVLAGIPDHRDSFLTEAERQSNQMIMICCSGALTERLVLDL